jgi:hypothetical protein
MRSSRSPLARVLGVHVEAAGAAVDLRRPDLHQFEQALFKRECAMVLVRSRRLLSDWGASFMRFRRGVMAFSVMGRKHDETRCPNVTTVVEEARKHAPVLEHVVHGLGDVFAARELGAGRFSLLTTAAGFPAASLYSGFAEPFRIGRHTPPVLTNYLFVRCAGHQTCGRLERGVDLFAHHQSGFAPRRLSSAEH